MAKKEKQTESIKIDSITVDAVRKNKDKTGVPIGEFFKQAANEKLKSQNKKV